MFRQIASRNIRAATQVRSQRFFAATAYRSSVIDTAKDLLNKANKKTGEVLADGIEKTEQVTPTTETVKNAADKVNKKTGEVLADGIEKTEDAIPSKGEVKNAAENAADKAKKTADNAADKAKGAAGEVSESAKHAAEKERIRQNHKGYEDLKDKGSKAETEQNRPDDAV